MKDFHFNHWNHSIGFYEWEKQQQHDCKTRGGAYESIEVKDSSSLVDCAFKIATSHK